MTQFIRNILHKTLAFAIDTIFPPSSTSLRLRKIIPTELKESSLPAPKAKHSFIVSIFDYKDDFVEQMIWELKFYKNKDVPRLCAPLIYSKIEDESILIPVPISKKKRRERGFNQTELLCEEIMKVDKHFILTYMPNILIKVKHTHNQHDIKSKHKRLENLKGAFSLTKTSDFSNQNVVIIDDVYTTGATLLEIKKVLEEAGAKSVRALTIAH